MRACIHACRQAGRQLGSVLCVAFGSSYMLRGRGTAPSAALPFATQHAHALPCPWPSLAAASLTFSAAVFSPAAGRAAAATTAGGAAPPTAAAARAARRAGGGAPPAPAPRPAAATAPPPWAGARRGRGPGAGRAGLAAARDWLGGGSSSSNREAAAAAANGGLPCTEGEALCSAWGAAAPGVCFACALCCAARRPAPTLPRPVHSPCCCRCSRAVPTHRGRTRSRSPVKARSVSRSPPPRGRSRSPADRSRSPSPRED